MPSLVRKAWSPTAYLLLLVLQILQYCCHADATIDIAPKTQHTNLSDIATFYCRATGLNTRWSIETFTYRTYNHTKSGYTFSEVIVSEENGIRVHDLYLQIPATVENNGTEVQCVTFDATPISSEIVSLIVQGGPAAPVPRLRMISPTLLLLEWEAPFTWPNTAIQHYSLSVNNSLEDWNQSVLTNTSVEIRASGNLAACTAYTFSVSANNGLAQGQLGNVTGGFPVVDPHMPAEPIQHAIHYDSDFTPFVQLYVTLPEVCSYQPVKYIVIATSTDSRVVFREESTVLYNDGATLNFMIPGSELDDSVTSLQINVTFVLVGVESTDSPLMTQMTIDVNPNGNGLVTDKVVLIAAVSGAVLLIAVVFTVVVASVCAYKRKRLYRSGSPKNSPMVTNPIYEGQSVYETIDPQFRAICSFTSSASIPGPPTPTSARPVIESPYAHCQVDPAYATAQLNSSPFPPAIMEEGYTVMTSAGGLGKKVSDYGESNLDQTVPDNARYAPEPSMVVNEC